MEKLKLRRSSINDLLMGYLDKAEPKELYKAVRHLPSVGGKRLRPLVAMLACEAVGGKMEKALPFGVALELIHTFTLIHDDIMDEDEERRGIPSVHARFGNDTAINAGDLLFAKAFHVLTDLDVEPTILKKLTREIAAMTIQICEGQQMDISFEEMEAGENKLMEMIEKKTARTFQSSAKGGAMIGNGGDIEVKAFENYGRNMGMAFQLWDDCLDVIGGEKLGKPIGSDIRKRKKTLLVLHAMKNAGEKDKKVLKSILGNKKVSEEEIDKAIKILKETGSINYVKEKAFDLASNAKKYLEKIDDSEAKNILIELADYAVERDK